MGILDNGDTLRIDDDKKNELFVVKDSDREGKDHKAVSQFDEDAIHFGNPDMPEFPGTERGDDFCSRSAGIQDGEGDLTKNDPDSANFWSRLDWACKDDKSLEEDDPQDVVDMLGL